MTKTFIYEKAKCDGCGAHGAAVDVIGTLLCEKCLLLALSEPQRSAETEPMEGEGFRSNDLDVRDASAASGAGSGIEAEAEGHEAEAAAPATARKGSEPESQLADVRTERGGAPSERLLCANVHCLLNRGYYGCRVYEWLGRKIPVTCWRKAEASVPHIIPAERRDASERTPPADGSVLWECTGCGVTGTWDQWASSAEPGKHLCDVCLLEGRTAAQLIKLSPNAAPNGRDARSVP